MALADDDHVGFVLQRGAANRFGDLAASKTR